MSLLLKHGTLATMVQGAMPYGLIGDGAVLVAEGRLAFVGPSKEAPAADETVDLEGRLVTPGLIDCHTHLVYGGSRSDEFEARLKGKSYAEIAQAGGGILSTVRATRAADEATLIARSIPRLDALLGEGVTTVEIKSGYGLDGRPSSRCCGWRGPWATAGRCRSSPPFSGRMRSRRNFARTAKAMSAWSAR